MIIFGRKFDTTDRIGSQYLAGKLLTGEACYFHAGQTYPVPIAVIR
jgi:hypothetical protein